MSELLAVGEKYIAEPSVVALRMALIQFAVDAGKIESTYIIQALCYGKANVMACPAESPRNVIDVAE